MSLFLTQEDGYASLTTAGVLAVIVWILAFLLVAAFLHEKEEATEGKSKGGFSTRQLVFCSAALALGFATSFIKLFHMPWGGSVTLCSMLFVVLIGYWYGPKVGLTAGFAYGLLQFMQGGGSYILSPFQVCMDYLFAFAALGLSGFFYKSKNGLLKGYLVAVFARGIFHTIGGYLYWLDYMPENFPASLAMIYPIAYNYAYLLGEALLTIIVISIPAVKKAFGHVKTMAVDTSEK